MYICAYMCVQSHIHMSVETRTWCYCLSSFTLPPIKTLSCWTWSSLINHSELWVLPFSASGPSYFRNSVPIISQCHLHPPNLNPCQSDRISYSAHFIVLESCTTRPLWWLLSLSIMFWRLSLVLFRYRAASHSSLWLYNSPLCSCATVCLFSGR